jgi:hypothetical protein
MAFAENTIHFAAKIYPMFALNLCSLSPNFPVDLQALDMAFAEKAPDYCLA